MFLLVLLDGQLRLSRCVSRHALVFRSFGSICKNFLQKKDRKLNRDDNSLEFVQCAYFLLDISKRIFEEDISIQVKISGVFTGTKSNEKV